MDIIKNKNTGMNSSACEFIPVIFKMTKQALFGVMVSFSINTSAQKLYVVTSFTSPFSGLSYAKQYQKDDIRPYNPRINLSWGVSLFYKEKR